MGEVLSFNVLFSGRMKLFGLKGAPAVWRGGILSICGAGAMAISLAGCFPSDDGSGGAPPLSALQKARNMNTAMEALWNRAAISAYSYEESHWSVYGSTYTGPCIVSPDTSSCNLRGQTDDGETVTEADSADLSQFFPMVDQQITFLNSLNVAAADSTYAVEFQGTDTSTIFELISHDNTGKKNGAIGFYVVYNRQFGFPESLSFAPFGPFFNITDFAKASGK